MIVPYKKCNGNLGSNFYYLMQSYTAKINLYFKKKLCFYNKFLLFYMVYRLMIPNYDKCAFLIFRISSVMHVYIFTIYFSFPTPAFIQDAIKMMDVDYLNKHLCHYIKGNIFFCRAANGQKALRGI